MWTHGVPEGLAAGIAAGTVLAALSWAALRGSRRARRLEAEFGELLGAQGRGEIVLLALLSGVAEEYFFRGALQERVGIWIAAGVFALLHWPLNRNLLPWPFLAGGVGVGLGYLCAWTGTLVAPAAAHALVNYVNLRRITARYGVWKEERVNAYIDRGRWT